jgi:3',5'-cyclic AMP phosphodiesterase CpdA
MRMTPSEYPQPAHVLDSIEASGLEPEAIILSGDLADDGNAEAYRRLRTTCEAYADRLGAKLIWVMGNHGERASSTPGHHHGEISAEQLRWLAAELETPAETAVVPVGEYPRMSMYITAEEARNRMLAASVSIAPSRDDLDSLAPAAPGRGLA